MRQIWKKKNSKVSHSSESRDNRTQKESHHYPAQRFLRLSPTLHCLVHHLPCKHLALCFAMCTDLSYAAILPSKFICFCRTKTFLLHLSKHIAAGKHSHSSCLCKQDWLICRLQPLVLNKGWFLQSSCILCLQQKSFAPNVGISLVIS